MRNQQSLFLSFGESERLLDGSLVWSAMSTVCDIIDCESCTFFLGVRDRKIDSVSIFIDGELRNLQTLCSEVME